MKKCIIIGAGTYGQVYSKYLSEEYDVVAFFDDDQRLLHKNILGIPVVGNVSEAVKYLLQNFKTSVFVPIGNNEVRMKLLERFHQYGFHTPSFISRNTSIDTSVDLGQSVYILPQTNIMPYSQLGDGVMISMGVNIAHHTSIDSGCFFSQGTNIGASISFEQNVFVGIASTVMTGVKRVGKSSLIGAGAVIIKDVPEYAKVVGNPGRIINQEQLAERKAKLTLIP